MGVTTVVDPVAMARVTYHSKTDFATAEARVRASLQKDPRWFKFQDNPSEKATSAEEFERFIRPGIGPHGFMYFTEINHGLWMRWFDVPTANVTDPNTGKLRHLRAIRFIIGNPLLAPIVLKHDLDCGLSVPAELFLVENPDGTVHLIRFKIDCLIAGHLNANAPLQENARFIDEKIDQLCRHVVGDDEVPRAQS
ncbi:uncharacterized protein Z520_07406 [Fonsecaea multimorphosa CBS 102226]|uniref:DUF302 domain-containing protein n=1 Tax=Fonsecaea multimorphosa CBS 102226 TaxID=1442371 RepID=A0A0D2JT82_9EURO|nr:uncharacterized protein Z520_07406 [Fonsecaea multimorphosa CBS 102226]KIX96687.1 hypothetical protein Z520_07406 [Fonsecaea multimorphosa CBS 102226]OAL20767.1 hypothetical protein AYO22_08776 [Fonsecaea multimorphosa]